jgi:hypothetical protein
MVFFYWYCKLCGESFESYNKNVAVAEKRLHIDESHPGAEWYAVDKTVKE